MQNLFAVAAAAVALSGPALAQEPVWDANKVQLESHKLADGVFAVIPAGAEEMAEKGLPIATTGGFVIGGNAVLVVESMLNERLNDQLFALIAAETDKPVRYLVNTSYHGDHSYGNFYIPEEVTIIQHEKAAEFIQSHLEEDKAFMIGNFGAGRGIEEIQPTAADLLVAAGGHVTVDLGGRRVEIQDFGFAQTGGDLFVSVPEAKVLWAGNPIIADPPALPWLLDGHLLETLATITAIRDHFPADTRIVPGHGPVTTMETVKWNIDYLTAVRDGVQKAIDEGLSLEETVKQVTLPEFQGYALRDWVHPGLNVPAAYKDLRP